MSRKCAPAKFVLLEPCESVLVQTIMYAYLHNSLSNPTDSSLVNIRSVYFTQQLV